MLYEDIFAVRILKNKIMKAGKTNFDETLPSRENHANQYSNSNWILMGYTARTNSKKYTQSNFLVLIILFA